MSADVQLGPDGDLPRVTAHIGGSAQTIQRLGIALSTTLREYFEVPSAGLPFEDWAALRLPALGEIANSVRFTAEATPGVLRVESVSAVRDDNTSTVEVSIVVVLPFDQAVQILLDIFGSGRGSSGGPGQSSGPPPSAGTPARVRSTILAPSGAITGPSQGGSGGIL